ncbi:hypothetical protein Pelo_17581 [Pelomyxa schiedti]|nr:hypothetical protein Pelo_17581 [Pelomyxa schiedti]
MATSTGVNYEEMGAQAVEQARATLSFPWVPIGEEQGVKIFRHSLPGSPINCMRGVVKFEPGVITTKGMLDLMADSAARPNYDPMFISGDTVEAIRSDENGNKLGIAHLRFKSGSMFVSNRDFACLVCSVHDTAAQSGVIVAKSITRPDIPEETGYVRAELLSSAFLIATTADGGLEVNYVVQLDPKGWVPTAVVNAVSKDQPMVLAKLKQYILKLKKH